MNKAIINHEFGDLFQAKFETKNDKNLGGTRCYEFKKDLIRNLKKHFPKFTIIDKTINHGIHS